MGGEKCAIQYDENGSDRDYRKNAADERAAELATLRAENEKLREKVKELERALVWAATHGARWMVGFNDCNSIHIDRDEQLGTEFDGTDADLIRVLIAASRGE